MLSESTSIPSPQQGVVGAFDTAAVPASPPAAQLLKPLQALKGGFVLMPQETAAAPDILPLPAPMPGKQAAASVPAMPSPLQARVPSHELAPHAAPAGRLAPAQAQQVRQGFVMGELHLMIRYEDGSELTDMPALSYLPNAPSWFLGFANLHGRLIPVFDLAAYLGFESLQTPNRMLLVLLHGDDSTGILIDDIPSRLHYNASHVLEDNNSAPARLAPHVKATCALNEHIWFDIHCASLLDAVEQSLSMH